MELLTTSRYREYLFDALRGANANVWLTSAYITVPGIEPILDLLGSKAMRVRVLARWDSRDLVSGASDLEVYEIVSARGFEFFINQRLHGKCALIDNAQLFVGSANLTASGLQLRIPGNLECGTVMEPSEADCATIRDLFADSILVTPLLYLEIKAFIVPLLTASERRDTIFPASIMEKLLGSVKGLWVRELPWTEGPQSIPQDEQDARHDLMLLNATLGPSPTIEELGTLFETTRCCRWLTSQLQTHGGQLYFGEAAELLHNALLEDPKPYRKEVKILMRNLFAWAAALPHAFIADAPNYSQRITLAESPSADDSRRFDAAHEAWITRLLNLHRDEIPGRWGSETRNGAPHKPLLLLAVIKTFGDGLIPEATKVELNSDLEASFYALWYALFQSERATNIALPFFHLSRDGMWNIFGADGTEIDAAAEVRSLRYLQEVKAYAELETSFCALLTSPELRTLAENALLDAYFSEKAEFALRNVLKLGGKGWRETGEPPTSA